MTETTMVPVSELTEAEWNPPARGGFAAKPNPYQDVVAHANKTGKPQALTFQLDAKDYAEQQKEIGKEIRLLRRAGDRLDPPRSIAAYAGEVDKKAGTVVVTFKVIDKIIRNAGDKTEDAA